MRTLGQKRAEFALEQVLTNAPKGEVKEFKTFCSGAPAVILQNGFGQALAFWYSKSNGKKDSRYQILLNMIMHWLCPKDGEGRIAFVAPCSSTREMVKAISGLPQQSYIAAQKETLALLEWVKRYANAVLKEIEK